MQKSGVCDTRCQLFFKEISRREQALKTKWFLANRQRLIDNLKNEKYIKKAHDIIKQEEIKKKRQQHERRHFIEELRKKVLIFISLLIYFIIYSLQFVLNFNKFCNFKQKKSSKKRILNGDHKSMILSQVITWNPSNQKSKKSCTLKMSEVSMHKRIIWKKGTFF